MKYLLPLIIVFLGLVMPAFANCDANEQQVVLGIESSDVKSARRVAADQLKAVFDRDLQGKACLQVVSSAERFSDEKIFDSLKTGAAVMGLPKLETLASSLREYQVFDLPFAFADFQAVAKFQTSPALAVAQKKFSVLNVQPLGFVHEGFDQLVLKKQILKPEDALGVRFDVSGGGSFADLVSAVKGIVKRRNNKSVAQSLTDGDFEIAPVTWNDLADPKLRDALGFVLETNHKYKGFQLVASQTWLNGLDAELRKNIVQTAQRGLNQIAFETVRRENVARNGLIRANKPVLALTQSQWLQWRSAVVRSWSRFAQNNGSELVTALENANRLP